MYKSSVWLNSNESNSTGSVVCFCGDVKYEDKLYHEYFIEIADCRNKIRLHRTDNETHEQFISKLETLKLEISAFINHLKSKNDT